MPFEILNSLHNIDIPMSAGIGIGIVMAALLTHLGIKRSKNKNEHTARTVTKTPTKTGRDFSNLTIQTAAFDENNLFFSSGSKKPKSEAEMKTSVVSPKKLLQDAIILDHNGKRISATDLLHSALKNSKDLLEKKQISDIIKNYSETKTHSSLQNIVNSILYNETSNVTTKPVMDIEEQLAKIALEAHKQEQLLKTEDDPEDFLEQFGKMNTINQVASNSIWVNWSVMNNGTTQLFNEVFKVHNKWGSMEAMEELKVILAKKTPHQTWSVISVIPVE